MSIDTPLASSPEVVLPPINWEETAIVRHFNAPLSNEALAEPRSEMIDLGPIDLKAFPGGNRYWMGHHVKDPGDTEIYLHPEFQSPELIRANELFFSAAKKICGEDNFERAGIKFQHTSKQLIGGEIDRTIEPHIDGLGPWHRNYDPYSLARFVGVACTTMPTQVVHGAKSPEDFTNVGENEFVGDITDETRFTIEEIPVNRLILLPTSALHLGVRAKRTTNRQFARWHLFI